MENFVRKEKTLSTVFVPVCSYHDSEAKSQNNEFVGALEGVIYPWFGIGFRIDRIQFSMENSKRDWTDHSKEAIQHAQKLGNLFVDEARLSGNTYPFVFQEVNEINMFLNNDPYMVEVPLIQSSPSKTIRTELYLF